MAAHLQPQHRVVIQGACLFWVPGGAQEQRACPPVPDVAVDVAADRFQVAIGNLGKGSPRASRSSRIGSALPPVFTCASKMARVASAKGDCEAPDGCGNPAWVAIWALSAPAASISARRAHPGWR